MLKIGETYVCSDTQCGCEIQVKRSPSSGDGKDQAPRCCCGREMSLKALLI